MSHTEQSVSGRPLILHLGSSALAEIDKALIERSGKSARTLVNNGALRVTLVSLGPGGVLQEHRAPGPISVHVTSGELAFTVADEVWTLSRGDLLSLEGGVPHSVRSDSGATFVLTIAMPV